MSSVLVVLLMVLTALAVLTSFQPYATATGAKKISSSNEITKIVHIDLNALKYVRGPNGGKYLILHGARVLQIPGQPVVPVKILSFKLPKNVEHVNVNVKATHEVNYGTLKISPAPAPLLNSGKAFPSKYSPPKYNVKVYKSNSFYPYKVYSYTVSRSRDGVEVNVYLYPVRYNPVTNEIRVLTNAVVSVNYELGKLKSGSAPIDVPNIIITSPQLKAQAQRLANFHNSTGLTSWVVTTTWIAKNFQPAPNPPVNGYANSTTDPYAYFNNATLPLDKSAIIGYNYTLAKKIIAFLQNESYGSNVEYVTIFGNARMVPPSYYWTDQYMYLLAYLGYSDMYDAWIPTDAFYAQPNYNSTHFSYEPRFYFGRIPVNPLTADIVVNKIIYYATHKSGGIENVTLSGGQVFETPYFLGETGVLEPLNYGWLDGVKVTEYFHTLRNFTYNNFVKMMYNSDMIVEITHGSGYSFWHHNDEISAWDFSMNSTYGSLPIYISGSCLNGAWDEEMYPSEFASGINGGTSIAEKMLYAPDGIIAYYGGDREAYGSTLAWFDNGTLVAPNDFGDLITEDGTVAGYYIGTHIYGYVTLGMMYYYALSLYNQWLGPKLRMIDPWDTGLNDNPWQRSYFEYSLIGDPALKVSGSGASYPSYNQPKVVIPNAVYNSNDVPMITRGKEVHINIQTDSPRVKVELLYLEHDYGSGMWGSADTYYDFILDMKTLSPTSSVGGINNFTYSFTPGREGTYILSVYSEDGKNTRFYMSCNSPMPPLEMHKSKVKGGEENWRNSNNTGPDIQVITLLDYGDVAFGKITNVTAVIYNAGTKMATDITVHFYLENYVLVFQQHNLTHPLIWLGNKTVSSLAPGEVAYVTIPWKAVNLIPLGLDPTNSSARWQYVVASADVLNDTNSANNAIWGLFHVHLPVDVWVQKVFIKNDPVMGEANYITFEISNIGTSESAISNVSVMDDYGYIKNLTVTLNPGETKFITVHWTPQYAGTDEIIVMANTPGDINTANDVGFYYPNGYYGITTFKVLSYDVTPRGLAQNNDNAKITLYNYGPLSSKGTTVELYEIKGVSQVDVESPHPYPNNYDHTWEISAQNATRIALHFNYLYVEPGYDYVYIYNSTGALQVEYTGFYQNLWTPFINGSKVYVELRSDEAVNYTGFYIDAYATGISFIGKSSVGSIASGSYSAVSIPLGNTFAGIHYFKIVSNTPGEVATLTTGGASNDVIYYTLNLTDTIAPELKSFSLADKVVNTRAPTLKFCWYDEIYSGFSKVSVEIDGISIMATLTTYGNNGTIVAHVPFLLSDGKHTVSVELTDNGGNTASMSWNFEVDTTPPELKITSPTNVPLTYNSVFWINGTTDPGASVTINGEQVTVNSDGTFTYKATLEDGENVFKVTATDSAGNSATEIVTVLYLPQLPELWKAINNINAEIGNIKSQISTMQSEISTLKGNVSQIENEISALDAKLNDLENALQENISALNMAIENMNTTLMEKINSNIQNLQNQINDLKGKADNLNTQISNIKAKNDEQSQAINTSDQIGYAGIVIAIIALIVAFAAAARKPKVEYVTRENESPQNEEEPHTLYPQEKIDEVEEEHH
ncbi:C25 family cysteine peptidase [Aciduliprofundum sp. MAR08-339]|uniref:C25 family cysteine peptidase n=1 Tax=Aciduliprofundum sp. (strain MAR08-339) TaxID=673860 RepID=UPI00308032AE